MSGESGESGKRGERGESGDKAVREEAEWGEEEGDGRRRIG